MNYEQIGSVLENIDEHAKTPEGRRLFHETLIEYKGESQRLYGLPLYVVYYDWWGTGEAEEWYAVDDEFYWESQIEMIAVFKVRDVDRAMFNELGTAETDKVYLGFADNGALYELTRDVADDMIGEYTRFHEREGAKANA